MFSFKKRRYFHVIVIGNVDGQLRIRSLSADSDRHPTRTELQDASIEAYENDGYTKVGKPVVLSIDEFKNKKDYELFNEEKSGTGV